MYVSSGNTKSSVKTVLPHFSFFSGKYKYRTETSAQNICESVHHYKQKDTLNENELWFSVGLLLIAANIVDSLTAWLQLSSSFGTPNSSIFYFLFFILLFQKLFEIPWLSKNVRICFFVTFTWEHWTTRWTREHSTTLYWRISKWSALNRTKIRMYCRIVSARNWKRFSCKMFSFIKTYWNFISLRDNIY